MRADWLLLKEVRDELWALWRRMPAAEFDVFLRSIDEEMCAYVESFREANGGAKRYVLTTPKLLKPDFPLGSKPQVRSVGAENYIGRKAWHIKLNLIVDRKIADWRRTHPR